MASEGSQDSREIARGNPPPTVTSPFAFHSRVTSFDSLKWKANVVPRSHFVLTVGDLGTRLKESFLAGYHVYNLMLQEQSSMFSFLTAEIQTSCLFSFQLAEQLTRLNIVIGCLASLLFILFVAFAIVVCLLHKARKAAASKQEVEEEDDPLPTLSGPRPSDHDFKIPEVRSTGSPKIPSTGNKPSYTPLNTGDSPNGGTSITIETTKF